MVRQLLKEGETPSVKGFKSKAGKTFEAGLRLNEAFEVVFAFADGRGGGGPRLPQLENPVGLSCPACGEGLVIAGRSAWGCSNWRTGCSWKVAFQEEGVPRDPREVARSLQEAARPSTKKG
jgi:DNA topoisomerase-3